MIDRMRNVFDILETPFFRASHPNSRGYKHGYQLWQQHHYKANDALRAATRKKDRTFTNIWDRWENELEYRNHQKPFIGTMSLCDISATSCRLRATRVNLGWNSENVNVHVDAYGRQFLKARSPESSWT